METMPAYSRGLAVRLLHQWANKPFLGKPYLKGGQCFGLWGYLFEVGGLLAANYREKLDAFGPAFLGMRGPSGAMKTFCIEVANDLVSEHRVSTSTSFFDFAMAKFTQRFGFEGDPWRHAHDRIDLESAGQFSWQCAQDAVALAAVHPETFRAMFERTYAPVSKEQWELAFSAGLDIGREQPRKDYEGATEAENKTFLEYCRQSHPQMYLKLVG
jgi:hypothetical protein